MPGRQLIDAGAIFAPLMQFTRIGLAVSGGPDSLALLLLAAEYARDHDAYDRFVVYSVDHRLRPEAAGEVQFVLDTATRLGLAARGLRWDGLKPSTGIQQAARRARYALMGRAMVEDSVEILVTAHHVGDQAETVLMRLAHGSGVEGLRGMDYFSEVNGIAIVRPLLGVDPVALAQVVATAGLTPVGDPSNLDTDYERVRWRHALPQLAALGIDARRLARFADRMRDADMAIAATANTVEFEAGIGSRQLSHKVLHDLPAGGRRKGHATPPARGSAPASSPTTSPASRRSRIRYAASRPSSGQVCMVASCLLTAKRSLSSGSRDGGSRRKSVEPAARVDA